MAITRLTDFITVATNKWTYGDSAFKYEGEVNQDHDTIYPLMVMTPPTSRMPDIYEGWEHYNVEMEFYNSYQTAAQNAVTLQQRWDNLQDLALEWLDNVLINYSGGTILNLAINTAPTPTQVYIDKESLQIERIKNDKNDKLCRITMRFDMRMFTRCFTPKSTYPNTITQLKLWLKADSSVTFSIPTKQVSAWTDQSGKDSNASQSTSSKQPLRYGYDGPKDKSRIVFDGTDDTMMSDDLAPFDSGELSFFVVAKRTNATTEDQIIFSMDRTDTTVFTIGVFSEKLQGTAINGSASLVVSSVVDNEEEWGIYYVQLKKNSVSNYSLISSVNDDVETTVSDAFSQNDYSTQQFQIGCTQDGGDDVFFFTGAVAEIIGYDKAISSDEKTQVLRYLNNKYKIY